MADFDNDVQVSDGRQPGTESVDGLQKYLNVIRNLDDFSTS